MQTKNDTSKPEALGAPSGSPPSTPETDAEVKLRSYRLSDAPDANIYIDAEHARRLKRERDAALTALIKIEEIFVDGCDTHEDWKSMGTIAREFLSENSQEEARGEGVTSRGLLAFGSKVLADLLQGEWEPDWEWQQEMLELATRHGLMATRPADQEDDPEEYDLIYIRLAPVVSFPPTLSTGASPMHSRL